MRAEDLILHELIELDSEDGIIRFAGQRAIISDAVAQGLLRKELINSFGKRVAQNILSRFGYVHGMRMAEAMQSQFKWNDQDQWCKAGLRIYALQGLFVLEPDSIDKFAEGGGTLRTSYEAEQHILHLGLAEYPTCWSICGLISGYMSFTKGREMYAFEDRCLGKGDAACHIIIKPAEEWLNTRDNELSVFKNVDIDYALKEVSEGLINAERELRNRKRMLNKIAQIPDDPSNIVARSSAIRRVIDLAKTVAKVDSTVLITGESGSGKERFARFIHDLSACSDGPFIGVNCGAITETLLESELFGHARGSFTGATVDRPGLFEAANGGTLFLDEVGDIPLPMQVKILRALQEREVRRVGENHNRNINVRVIAATNKDLEAEIDKKRFREDLFYRLKVFELPVPPLRERRDDILPLARILVAESALHMKRPLSGLSGLAADCLLNYSWPGNVRELANAMERAVVVTKGKRIEPEDLPPEIRDTLSLQRFTNGGEVLLLKEMEKEYILSVLGKNNGNRKQTALALGIGTATLQRKLKSYKTDDNTI